MFINIYCCKGCKIKSPRNLKKNLSFHRITKKNRSNYPYIMEIFDRTRVKHPEAGADPGFCVGGAATQNVGGLTRGA